MKINSCPCCGAALLRHARKTDLYWFCTSCRQEMPASIVNEMLPSKSLLTSVTKQRQPKPTV